MTGRDRPFALAMAIWLLGGAIHWLMYAYIPELVSAALIGLFIVVAPAGLIAWGAWRAFRKRGSWLAPPAVIIGLITLLAASIPLIPASINIKFWSDRAQYEAVVADLKSGRLPQRPGVEMRAHSVAYSLPPREPGVVTFVWFDGLDATSGVVYDERNCPPREPREGQAAGPKELNPLDGHFCYYVQR